MKIHMSIIAIVMMMSFVSCSPENGEHFNDSYDILHQILSQLPEETHYIDFTARADHEQYLLHGWSEPEVTHRWSNSTRAALLFYSYDDKHDRFVEITWRALESHRKMQQMADILVNGEKISALIVSPTLRVDRVLLPASALHPGLNRLEFRFSYVEKAKNIYPDSQDTRELSVAFKRILFQHEPAIRGIGQHEWLQKAGPQMAFFVALPAKFELDIEYRASGRAKSSLEIIGEHSEKVEIRLPASKVNVKKQIQFPQKGIYMLSLAAGGDIVWKRIQVNMQKPEAPPPVLQNPGFSKHSTPDILVYVVDTLRADHLGCYGYKRNTSPHIDAFAKEHALYRNAYSTASWTRASGASIVTGLLPRNHHTMTRQEKLPDELVTLAEILRQAGYYTVYVNTNGNVSDAFGFTQGYDKFIRLPESHSSESIHVLSDTVNEHVVDFLREYEQNDASKPLFLLIWVTDPHYPYTPPEYAKTLFKIQQYTPIATTLTAFMSIMSGAIHPTLSQIEFMKTRYDQEIFANDNSFGKLLDRLKTYGFYEDMMIVFTADHGEEFFEHGGVGHGMTLYNEQIRVPLIIKARQLGQGVYQENVQITDIYPTISDILGIDPPYPLDGTSLLSRQDNNRILYFEENLDGNDVFSRLDNRKKFICNKQFNRPPSKKALPLIETYKVEDIHEEKNLNMENFEDYFRLQQLVSYMTGKSSLDIQKKDAAIPPELDQTLKDLGYVQ